MAQARGSTLTVFAMLLVVLVIGAKMLWRGQAQLHQAQDTARQSAPLEWPPRPAPASDAVCHTVKLTTAQANKAMEDGYAIDPSRRCITREAQAAHDQAQQRWQQARDQRAEDERKQALERKLQAELQQTLDQQVERGAVALENLAQARAGKATHIQSALLPAARTAPTPLPQPPASLFVPMPYQSQGLTLAAFATPDPRDGQRHPVMVWLTGGDSNTLGDFWSEGGAHNDQSASAFRKAGMVMVFPTLRGGNANPGEREYFWGEVDDVVAAIAQAARLPYADPQRIYLGGHSTGGTLALLAAATGLPVRGVFAFGPVADPKGYQWPVRWKDLSAEELRLRSPVHWLHAVKAPTWIIEGADAPGNRGSLEELCAARKSAQVHCALVAGKDHFSVLQPATRTLAAQLVMGQEPRLESLPLRASADGVR
ncbi:MAG: prolyl oligopeptidase family serine peptidase [Acidovorax sp.]|uniref:alpha/beta hydrolase family protein n=1 Tax=Acidovorax sp. TaxID=1872122 RepID=UPI0039E49BED